VTGYWPGRRKLRGQVGFQSGEISPRQFVMSRISRRQLSESQHLYREWGMESGMGNCVLPRSPLPIPQSPFPTPLPSGHTQTKKPGDEPGFSCVWLP